MAVVPAARGMIAKRRLRVVYMSPPMRSEPWVKWLVKSGVSEKPFEKDFSSDSGLQRWSCWIGALARSATVKVSTACSPT